MKPAQRVWNYLPHQRGGYVTSSLKLARISAINAARASQGDSAQAFSPTVLKVNVKSRYAIKDPFYKRISRIMTRGVAARYIKSMPRARGRAARGRY